MATTPQYVIPVSSQKPKVVTLVPSDPGSRYKTQQLQIQVVGKSKMIKTMLVNILDVAKNMQIPPTYLGTFFAYQIGAKNAFDEKKAERQQAYVTGEQDVKDLSRLTEQFIHEVLLCPNCGLPELLIQIQQKEPWGLCRACGANSKLPITNDKFKRYIVNHPPGNDKGTVGGVFKGNQSGTKKKKMERKRTKNLKAMKKMKKKVVKKMEPKKANLLMLLQQPLLKPKNQLKNPRKRKRKKRKKKNHQRRKKKMMTNLMSFGTLIHLMKQQENEEKLYYLTVQLRH